MSADEGEDEDVDPLNRSLQRFKMLSHLALLDKPVDTKCIACYSALVPIPAGQWQVLLSRGLT